MMFSLFFNYGFISNFFLSYPNQRFELQHVNWSNPLYLRESDIYREAVSTLLLLSLFLFFPLAAPCQIHGTEILYCKLKKLLIHMSIYVKIIRVL